jgi:hypothetical protein
MLIEIDGQFYNSTDNFYSPDWWDEWQTQNFKKSRIIPKKAQASGTRRD